MLQVDISCSMSPVSSHYRYLLLLQISVLKIISTGKCYR